MDSSLHSLGRRRFLAGLGAATLSATGGTVRAIADDGAPPIRIAQIGTEHPHASGKMEAIKGLPDLYEVVAWAKSDADDEIAAILSDRSTQVIVVETGPELATPMALRAIRAGKHVHLDKPGGFDHGAFAAMRREAERAGKVVQMGYMLRENPGIAFLFRAAREGWFGTIMEVNASMGKLAGQGLRDALADYPGNGMFELGCHLVDTVVTLLGAPEQVWAMAAATRAPGDELRDNQLAVLRCGAALATLRCNHADPAGGPRRTISVAGTGGRASITPLESGTVELELDQPSGEFAAGRHTVAIPPGGGRYDGEFRTLAGCVRGEQTYAWDAAHDIAVHAAALRAAGVEVP